MAKFEVTKDNTVNKIKAAAKAEVMEVIIAALNEHYGEDNVKFVRTGGGTSKKNELAVKVGEATIGDIDFPVCVTVNGSGKDFTDRDTAKKTFEAFDFYGAAQAYEDYLAEKAEKDAAKAEAKNKKIAADEKRRAKKNDSVEF